VPKPQNVISCWHQLFEQYQASSLEFYAAVEKAVAAREVPETHWTRVEHKEAGLASANREYLRMQRGKFAFDICAAPFGNGFFVSWWLTEPPLRFGFLYTLVFLIAVLVCFNIVYAVGFGIGATTSGYGTGMVDGFCLSVIGVPAFLWFLGNTLRRGIIQGESTVLAIPLVGWVYERVFAPETYYSLDTAAMFQESIDAAVQEVINSMAAAKGIRALTEQERKPVMKRFAASL
jgi:hypothetical protein